MFELLLTVRKLVFFLTINIFNLRDFQETPWYPLNIPTPTPAPDWGGPVACRGGPVAPIEPPLINNERVNRSFFKYHMMCKSLSRCSSKFNNRCEWFKGGLCDDRNGCKWLNQKYSKRKRD